MVYKKRKARLTSSVVAHNSCCGGVWRSLASASVLGTEGPKVQILSPRPFLLSGRIGRVRIQGSIPNIHSDDWQLPKNPVIAGKIHKDFFKWTESGQTDMEINW